jgi:hypothetical protein
LRTAFILGRTIAEESHNLEGVLFNQKVQGGRRNVFLFSIEFANGRPHIVIHRLDEHLKEIFRDRLPRLDEMTSADRALSNDPDKRLELRDRIRGLRAKPKDELRSRICDQAPHCVGNYALSCRTAELAYALMLAETSHKDAAECRKFEGSDVNLFGDTNVVQEALLFEAQILSSDAHTRLMASYCGMRCLD